MGGYGMTRGQEYKSEADFLYDGNFKDIQKMAFIEGAKWDLDKCINTTLKIK